MNTFLNFSATSGVTSSSSRNNGVSCGDDIIDFCREVQRERECTFTPHEEIGFYLDALSDGSLLDGLEQEIVENVYSELEKLA